ncbi:MAG: type II secretion system protein N, partial [Casimicrobiaceae bacterium]
MRAWLVIGAAALLLAAAVAIEAPATLVDQRVQAATAGRVRIAAATGTVWHGSGALTLMPGGIRTPIAWRIDPMPLLGGELTGSIEVAGALRPSEFRVGAEGDFAVQDLMVTMPAAAVLRAAGIPAMLAAAGGTVALDASNLVRHGDRLDGRAKLVWQNATLPGPRAGTRIALGEVRLDAAGSGEQIPATLANSGGDVEIAGNVVLTLRGMPRVDMHARPRAGIGAERSDAVAALLSTVGRSDGAGGFRIVWPWL